LATIGTAHIFVQPLIDFYLLMAFGVHNSWCSQCTLL